MASQSVPPNAKPSPSNFRSKTSPLPSNIVTAPSKTVIKEPPPLFPPNPLLDELPKPKSTNDVYLLRKSVSLKQLFRSSPFFLQHQQKTKDIERYSDTYLSKEPLIDVNNVIVASSGMFPSELISEKDKRILKANLLKRKLPDAVPSPFIASDTVPNQSTKKGKKKNETTKKTTKTKRKKENSEMEMEENVVSKPKATKGKGKKGKEVESKSPEKVIPVRLTKLSDKNFQTRDEMDFQALEKLEEQEAKETEENDDQDTSKKKKKQTEHDMEDEENVDLEDADDNLLDEEDYHNLFDNDDVEDDYNDGAGSDGEPYMD